jgi:hypothetical protein
VTVGGAKYVPVPVLNDGVYGVVSVKVAEFTALLVPALIATISTVVVVLMVMGPV